MTGEEMRALLHLLKKLSDGLEAIKDNHLNMLVMTLHTGIVSHMDEQDEDIRKTFDELMSALAGVISISGFTQQVHIDNQIDALKGGKK